VSEHPQPEARHRYIVLAVVLTASFMVLLDISIVNVAIPSIQRNLNASYGQIQLVIALYSLAYAVVLITGGRLGDIFGRKRLFMIGMTGFTLASAACGFAQSPEMLITSRVVQGTMAALMYPQVLSVIQVTFPVRQRGAAFAVLGATIGIATITGPLLGGLLIQLNVAGLDWRPIFLVNVPVGIGAVGGAMYLLHETKAPDAPHLDIPGVILATLGLGLVIYPLIEGRDAGWPAWAFISMVASVPFLVAFAWYERRRTQANNSPLVDTSLFQHRSFVAGIFVGMAMFSGIPAFFLTFTLLLQIGLGFTPLEAGVTSVPFAFGSLVASIYSARLAPRLGRYILSLGAGVLALGGLGVIITLHLGGISIQGWYLAPALLVCGIGLGLFVAPLINIVLAAVPVRSAGSASGVFTTVQQFGTSFGIALVGVVLFSLLGANADQAARDAEGAVLNPQMVALSLPDSLISRVDQSFLACFHDRANASDPTATPPSCVKAQQTRLAPEALAALGPDAPARLGKLQGIFQQAGLDALKRDFVATAQPSTGFSVFMWFITFLLVPFLPRRMVTHGAPAPA
jgi:EmrB/QacA subfamily drug resistance transporter